MIPNGSCVTAPKNLQTLPFAFRCFGSGNAAPAVSSDLFQTIHAVCFALEFLCSISGTHTRTHNRGPSPVIGEVVPC